MDDLPTSTYVRVGDAIAAQIEGGAYAPKGRLPDEPDVAPSR